jgi:hypothetical protein
MAPVEFNDEFAMSIVEVAENDLEQAHYPWQHSSVLSQICEMNMNVMAMEIAHRLSTQPGVIKENLTERLPRHIRSSPGL